MARRRGAGALSRGGRVARRRSWTRRARGRSTACLPSAIVPSFSRRARRGRSACRATRRKRRPRAQTRGWRVSAWPRPACRCPGSSTCRAPTRHPRRATPRVALPVRRQAAGAVGQPRRDAREFARGARRRARAARRAALAQGRARDAQRPRATRCSIEGFIEGREYAVEGVLTQGALQAFAIFDKPDPLDGPFFEETIYVTPSALPAAAQQAVARSRAARGLGAGLTTARSTPSAGSAPAASSCSKSRRGRSAGSARGCCGSRDERVPCSLGRSPASTRDGRRHLARTCARRRPPAVMMIPIPKRGILKQVDGDRGRGGRARHRGGADHREARSAARAAAGSGSYLGFIFAARRIRDRRSRARRRARAPAVPHRAPIDVSPKIADRRT